MSGRWSGVGLIAAVAVLIAVTIGVQVVRDRRYAAGVTQSGLLYVRSGPALQRLALSFDGLLADVYWIRAIQHYGRTKISEDSEKTYELLYPLLDLTTTLDPRFNIAYRFGAIFLTEAYPNGPGQPQEAIALLKKGVAAMPDRWQYVMDIGFVHYWWLHDYAAAAEWFHAASQIEGAPWWAESMAATTMAQGGQREASRRLWRQLGESADNEWLQNESARRLLQLDALDVIDQLRQVVEVYRAREGEWPRVWDDLVVAGVLPGIPVDPTGTVYRLTPETGDVSVAGDSRLYPLPAEPEARPGTAP